MADGSDIQTFGVIDSPPGVSVFDTSGAQIPIIFFISKLIQVATVIAGIWVIYNFLLAGFQYVTSSGDSSASTKVRDTLNMSIIGLLLIIGSYAIAGVIGLIIFGDASYILSPTLPSPAGGS